MGAQLFFVQRINNVSVPCAGEGGLGLGLEGGGEWVCFWLLLEPTKCLSYLEDFEKKKKLQK